MSVRSLGQLTLDLVAKTGGFTGPMDRASRRTKKQMSDMGKQVEAASNKIAMLSVAAASAAATGIAVMTRSAMDNIDANAKLARSLDGTIDGLRAVQLAASDSGLDGMEASLNRMNRRLGAVEMNGGPALKTVQRLNLDLQRMQGMDVDEKLAYIADQIKGAGISSQEAARHLQQLGFEQRAAAELFVRGGDAIRGAREEMEAFGLSISMVDAAVIEEANTALSRAGLLTESIRNSLAVELAPIILEIASRFNDAAREAGGLGQVVHDSVRTSIEIVARLADSFAHVNRTIHVAGVGTREFGLTVVRGMYDASRAIMEGPVNALNHMIEAMNRLPGIDIGFVDQPEMVYQAREQVEALERSIRAARQEIEDTLAADLPSVAIFGFLDDVDRRMEEMRQNIGDGPGLGEMLFDADDERALAKADQDVKKLESSYESLLDRLYPIEASQRRFREEMELLDLAAQAGAIDDLADAQQRLLQSAGDWQDTYNFDGMGGEGEGGGYWERWLEGAENAFTDFDQMAANTAENFQRQFGNAFESMIFDSQSLGDAVHGMADSMLRSVVNALGQMAAQWIAYQGVQIAMGKTAESAAVASAAATGSSIAAAYAPAAAMASLASFGANSAPAMAGIAATSAMAKSMSLMGMAHDGIDSIPREGTWLLDKGERVLNAPQANKLDRFLDQQQAQDRRRDGGGVTVNIIENPERAGQRETTVNADGREEESLFVADIYGDGPRSRAIQNAFGLQRRGR